MSKKISKRDQKLAAMRAAQEGLTLYTVDEITKFLRHLNRRCCQKCCITLDMEAATMKQVGVIPCTGVQPDQLPSPVVEEILMKLKITTQAEKQVKKAQALQKKKKNKAAQQKAGQRQKRKERAKREGPAREEELRKKIALERWFSRNKDLLKLK